MASPPEDISEYDFCLQALHNSIVELSKKVKDLQARVECLEALG